MNEIENQRNENLENKLIKEEDIKNDVSEENFDNRKLYKSISVFLVVLFITLFNTANVKAFTTKIVKCFDDQAFEASRFLYNLMKEHKGFKYFVMITAGLAEDLAVLLGFFFFVFKFRSWRLIVCLGIVYLLRGIFQNLYLMAIPEENLFEYPGFPSLFVPYLSTNDYFFSGHVSLPTVVSIEFYRTGYFKTSISVFFVGVYQMIMMLGVRGHYGIDLYSGFIFSFYSCKLGNDFAKCIDQTRIGLKDEDFPEENKLNDGSLNAIPMVTREGSQNLNLA